MAERPQTSCPLAAQPGGSRAGHRHCHEEHQEEQECVPEHPHVRATWDGQDTVCQGEGTVAGGYGVSPTGERCRGRGTRGRQPLPSSSRKGVSPHAVWSPATGAVGWRADGAGIKVPFPPRNSRCTQAWTTPS